MRSPCPSLPRILLLAALVLTSITWDAAPARAADTMPDVVGRREARAVRLLEEKGLVVHVVTIAGHPAGVVASQIPAGGEAVDDGEEVEIHVGVALAIRTTAPSAIGMTEQQAIDALDETYFLEISYAAGPAAREGRVFEQDPAPGSSIPFRGVMRLRIVRNGAVVPALVGRQEADALRLVEDAGLVASITYVRRGGAEGLVVSQVPRSGAEILPGGTVELRVVGERRGGGERRRRVRVPSLIGLSMEDAEEQLFAAGLTPHEHLVAASGGAAWTVLSQEVAAGSIVVEGSSVGFDVAQPGVRPDVLRMPTLYGLPADDARDLLEHMGLSSTITRVRSALARGTVFGQSLAPGRRVRAGTSVELTVARGLRRDEPARTVVVPDLANLGAGAARIALLSAGLDWRQGRDNGPSGQLHRVFRQEPAAGARVPEGSAVHFYLPYVATVPSLIGKTRLEALDALQAAGLQGLARLSGADHAGASEVISQSVVAGKAVPRGRLIPFRYRKVAPPVPMVAVGSVIGLDAATAKAQLEAAGFVVNLRALHVGSGATRVVSQTPAAGSLVPRGTRILVTYRYVGIFGTYVRVPRVIGLTHRAAQAQLEALGFRVLLTRSGGAVFGGATQVIAQNPTGGSALARGSRIHLTYRYVRGGGGGGVISRVTVPSLVGLRVDVALGRLRALGLNASLRGIGGRVRSQSHRVGTHVARGTTVIIRLRP